MGLQEPPEGPPPAPGCSPLYLRSLQLHIHTALSVAAADKLLLDLQQAVTQLVQQRQELRGLPAGRLPGSLGPEAQAPAGDRGSALGSSVERMAKPGGTTRKVAQKQAEAPKH